MEKYVTKKHLGQNFIKNHQLLRKIVDFIDIKPEDLIIEIGLGQGDLTKIIAEKNPYYLGFEIDKDLEQYLIKYVGEKSKIFFDDFLKVDLKEKIKKIKYDNLYIIANLPYYITTPIINTIIKSDVLVNKMLLMVQKEVGERFIASPGSKNYNSITVYLNYYFDIKKVLNVSKSNFYPKPKVDSSVLLFEKKQIIKKANDMIFFEKVLKDSFQFKRKTIKNNLKNYDLNVIKNILEENDLTLSSRAEEIPLDVFIEFANKLGK